MPMCNGEETDTLEIADDPSSQISSKLSVVTAAAECFANQTKH